MTHITTAAVRRPEPQLTADGGPEGSAHASSADAVMLAIALRYLASRRAKPTLRLVPAAG